MGTIYDETLAAMRALGRGTVEEKDFFPSTRRAYRYAQLVIEAPQEEAPDLVRALLPIARTAAAHLSVWTHYGPGCQIHMAVDRPLTDEEIGDDPPCASRAAV